MQNLPLTLLFDHFHTFLQLKNKINMSYTTTPIKKLLVANRGEIAIRILRACTELSIGTVAVYTFEDRYSLHRYKADEAYQIGKDEDPLKPYLDIEGIIEVALENKVDAIHPGYGFLSENVEFARRCREVGLIFVGPDPEVMEQLGDKIMAKQVARAAGVPIIESNEGKLTTVKKALSEAKRIGYPLIVKAASGGGGRGMRIVRSDDDLKTAFIEARREALNSFGDDTIFLEKFIENPKHIEVQIIGDKYGNLVHLYERDCSVQRRFQKIVEVAPAPSLPKECKKALYEFALRITRHVKYNNAGTVEFLVDEDYNIYFIEVNPRIQVEHTITEVVTGIDIVRSQIYIAAGYPLRAPEIDISQEDITINGFAIQCRVTTEDPLNDFKPDYGTVIAYRNAGGFGIRIDEGSSYPGVKISPFFDSMLAKVTAFGRTLPDACNRLDRTLMEYRIRGVKDNIRFLRNILKHDEFRSGEARVHFIKSYPEIFTYPKRRNRATKLLRFLADVSVNGNQDIPFKDDRIRLSSPVIPDFDKKAAHPKGTKNILDEKGPDGLVKWLKSQKNIQITDTTMRDAHQSLLATRVRTIDLLNVAEGFSKANPNLFSMEVWGGATFDVAMRFLKESPWERLRLLREAIPNTMLQMLLRGSNAIGYTAYPDNLVEMFIEKSWENGVDVFRIFDSLNWIENMKVSIKAVKERTGGIAEACLSYTGDILDPKKKKYTLQYYLDLAKQLEDAGAHIIAIKDMAGLLKPYAAYLLVNELKKVVDTPIHLHTHDTSAAQLSTYMKAIEAGVDVVDCALASMSGLTSQPNFNTLVKMLQGSGRVPDIDVNSLNEYSDYWADVRKMYYPFEAGLKAGTATVYEHEIPGGQYSNLNRQAEALGLGGRMNEIEKTYTDVNQLMGDIVKVTPSSKVVGDLALYMVTNGLTKQDILERGETINFPQSTISFFKGELGQPYKGFPKELQKMVLKGEKPYKKRANAHLKQVNFEKEYKAYQKEYEDRPSFEDFLSWKFYPKVFDAYYKHFQEYGNVSVVPSSVFFYGLERGDETIFEMAPGKNILIRLSYIGEPNEEGIRNISFKLNGRARVLAVRDETIEVEIIKNRKADEANHVGAPLQGLLSKIFVKPGDSVQKNTPLFIIEAMKMETTVTAQGPGKVASIVLSEGTMVESEDLVVELD